MREREKERAENMREDYKCEGKYFDVWKLQRKKNWAKKKAKPSLRRSEAEPHKLLIIFFVLLIFMFVYYVLLLIFFALSLTDFHIIFLWLLFGVSPNVSCAIAPNVRSMCSCVLWLQCIKLISHDIFEIKKNIILTSQTHLHSELGCCVFFRWRFYAVYPNTLSET